MEGAAVYAALRANRDASTPEDDVVGVVEHGVIGDLPPANGTTGSGAGNDDGAASHGGGATQSSSARDLGNGNTPRVARKNGDLVIETRTGTRYDALYRVDQENGALSSIGGGRIINRVCTILRRQWFVKFI